MFPFKTLSSHILENGPSDEINFWVYMLPRGIFSATVKRFYGSADLSTSFTLFWQDFFYVLYLFSLVKFLTTWCLEKYIFISVMWSSILVLHHFIFDSKKLACTRTWAEQNMCPCMLRVLRGCPFSGEHFYLWMSCLELHVWATRERRRVVATGTHPSSTWPLSSTRPRGNSGTIFNLTVFKQKTVEKSFIKEKKP